MNPIPASSAGAASDPAAGHLKILGVLGSGGMGEVFVGYDERLRRRVALKALRPRDRLDPAGKAGLLREARILSRLDHPNICRIHDYVEGRDRDFLVLELVEGESLDQVLAKGVSESDRLSIAEQVAEGLDAAHAQGVVHRDLKPSNVMITAGGGVKILDFGIARPLHEDSPDGPEGPMPPAPGPDEEATLAFPLLPPGPAPAEAAEPAESTEPEPETREDDTETVDLGDGPDPDGFTSPGRVGGDRVLGTPAYLSPEQARREPITAASDMYAFGLVLQELLTGSPPHPPGLDTRELVARAQRGETLPVEGVDRDLASLVSDLLQAAPARRPTAAEALRRLRWIRGKPRRRALRLAAGVVLLLLGLGLAKYTVDLRAARDRADLHRGQAEELVGFMLGDLREKLSGVGRLDLMEDVGDQTLAYFEDLPEEERTPEALERWADALRLIGQVRIDQGDLTAATDALEQSLRISRELVELGPERGDRLLGLGHSHYWLGNVAWRRGDLDAALERFEEYRDIAERLAAAEPDETEWRLETAYAYTNLAAVQDARGEDDRALAALRRSIEIKEDLVAEDPANGEWRTSLANGLSWLGSQLEERGDLAGALRSFETEGRMRRELIADDPDQPEKRYLLAVNLAQEGRLRLLVGETRRAAAALEEAGDLNRSLVAHDPANSLWKRNLGVAYRDQGELRAAVGDRSGADAALAEAVAILGELVRRDPSNADWRKALVLARLLTGEAALSRGDVETASAAADRATTLLEPTSRAVEEPPEIRWLRGRKHLLKGRALDLSGRSREARAELDEAYAVLSALTADSRDVNVLDTWARLLLALDHHEAETVVEDLLATGYRRPDFLACCARAASEPATSPAHSGTPD